MYVTWGFRRDGSFTKAVLAKRWQDSLKNLRLYPDGVDDLLAVCDDVNDNDERGENRDEKQSIDN